MLSSTSWFTLSPSFHEYESVGRQLLQKWHHHSLTLSHKNATSPSLSVKILWPVPTLLNHSRLKNPTFINSMIAHRTQNLESSTNALPDPQIGYVSLKNNPQVSPSFSLYVRFPKSFVCYLPSTNSIPKQNLTTHNK